MQGKPSLVGVLGGLVLLAGCGRTEWQPFVRAAAAGDGGPANPGDTAMVAKGPCREATGPTTLFRTCEPEGRCAIFGTGSPSASARQSCYANGVMVSTQGGWNGKNVYHDLSVNRDGSLCYQILETDPPSGPGADYVITGAAGKRVAAGKADPETGTITCDDDGTPTEVSEACLQPLQGNESECEWNLPDWSAACS